MNSHFRKIRMSDVAPNRRRGGDLRVLISPATAQATGGLLGVVTLEPGESVGEHYHPYSEESLYVVRGKVSVRLNGVTDELAAGEALLVPKFVRHRLQNDTDEPVSVVFALSGLAPRPELGHVDTEGAEDGA